MSQGGRLRGWRAYVVMGASGFALAYAIVAIFVFPAGATQHDATVPNVVGLPAADATRLLEQAGFSVQRGPSRFHNAAPRGTVLEQNPEAELTASTRTRVSLTLSGGPQMGTVPGVIGMSREQALNALETAGFQAGEVSERASNEPRGAIIDSRPRPGAQAPMPSAVALVISAGPTNIMVPDLVGRPLADAAQLLRQVGLAIGETRYAGSSLTDAGAVIIAQSPTSSTQVTAGTKVDVTVGSRTP